MKLPILATVAALALAAVAAAQAQPDTRSGPVYGYQAPQPGSGPYSYPPDLDAPLLPGRDPGGRIIPMSARNDVGLHCPADKMKLCVSRTTELSAYRCLIFHRSKLSSPCQHAVDELTADHKGAL